MKGEVTDKEDDVKVGEEIDTIYNDNVNNTDNPPNNETQKSDSGEKVYICPYCGAKFNQSIDYARHIRLKHPDKAKDKRHTKKKDEDMGTPHPPEEEELIKSPKEELEEWFISELEKDLPLIVGNKKVKPIMKTLRQYPDIIWDPNRLRYHILQIAPNAHDYLLDWTLTGLYKGLQKLKAKFEGRFGYMLPTITPPEQGLGFGYSGITPPRERGVGYHEHPQPPYPGHEITRPPSWEGTSGQGTSVRDALLIKLIDKLFDKLEDKEGEKQKEPLVEIPNPWGAGTIKIPASQAPTYLMIKSVQDQISALKRTIEDQKPKEESEGPKEPKEPTVKIQTEDGKEIELPASQAVYYIQVMHEKERAKMLERRLETMEKQMQQLYQNMAPERVVKAFEELGYYKQPSPTYDLINKTRQDLNNMLDRILGIMELQMKRQMPPNLPQLRDQYESKYTPEERKKKIEAIKQNIKKAENIAKLEKEIAETVESK